MSKGVDVMFRSMWLPLSLMLVLPAMVSDAAGEEGRKLPRLVPSFDGEDGQVGKATNSPVRRTAFQRAIDRVRPSTRMLQPENQSPLDKLNAGTKRLLVKTKRVLTPWKYTKPKQAGPKTARSELRPFWRKTNSSGPKKGSLLSSWFAKQPPKPKPTTVSEWLGQPKP
jgi:hypothetical protein